MNLNADKRGAGILMHITSLPSLFGIGDMGPEAYKFADFLQRSKQTYWQILPLTPTEAQSDYSPYSSYSALGGNTMLISPELLAEDNLLSHEDIYSCQLPAKEYVNFKEGCAIKEKLLEIAYKNFLVHEDDLTNYSFNAFCKKEKYWLDDFALFMLLKETFDSKPWYEWPMQYKFRDIAALETISLKEANYLKKIKWLQFTFNKQWQLLKQYCNNKDIQIFGDMPFYVSYDSADVWANSDIFSLDEDGNMVKIAGVPPDYFTKDGQLWGMPTYKWDILKQQHYKWWMNRIRKNIELYNLLRLDHFRALQDYWEVPAGEETARNGEWLPGPQTDFFDEIQKELGPLPIIAEDLGYQMDDVYKLRDAVKLPGMKVLQFAFGENMSESVDIPHNYKPYCVAYTGTHDNNTVKGWYTNEAKPEDLERLKSYAGYPVNDKNVHLVLGRMAYASVAFIAILPLQDILGLGEDARMNKPGVYSSNWLWRLQPHQIDATIEKRLIEWVTLYNR